MDVRYRNTVIPAITKSFKGNLPQLVDAGLNTSVCPGHCTRLCANPLTTFNPFTFRWIPGAGLNDSTIQDPLACRSTSTIYEVRMTDKNNCVGRDWVEVTVGYRA